MTESILKRARKAVSVVTKQFGEGALMLMSDDGVRRIDAIPTGSLGLDRVLGVGGIPRGRVVEIYGPEASGKTTLTLHLAAETQRAGGLVAFVDAEHALDRVYAQRIGVDVDTLLLSQPDSGEEALEIVERLVRDVGVELIVVDSVAALVPRAEIEGSMGDRHVGLQARLMSQALRKLTSVVHQKGSTLVFINQLRTKIGVTFGSPETTTGGRALRFYSSVRLDIRRVGTLKQGDVPYGSRARVKVVKNKVAPPHGRAEFDIIYGRGIERAGELLDYGLELGFCKKSGSWFSLGEQRLGQGRVRAIAALQANESLLSTLEGQVRSAWADVAPAALAA